MKCVSVLNLDTLVSNTRIKYELLSSLVFRHSGAPSPHKFIGSLQGYRSTSIKKVAFGCGDAEERPKKEEHVNPVTVQSQCGTDPAICSQQFITLVLNHRKIK